MNHKSNGFITGFSLKLIAMLSMIIDHVGYIFFPNVLFLRGFGRLAFPIFCFLLVEGFFHTKNQLSYFKRLLFFAFLSELPFDLALHNSFLDWQHQNVFFTLALGLSSIFFLEEMTIKKSYSLLLFLNFIIAYFLNCDYGIGGILLILIFYKAKESPFIYFVLSALIYYLFFNTFQLFALFAFIPIAFYNGKRGPSSQIYFYFIYPVHLLLLYFIVNFII